MIGITRASLAMGLTGTVAACLSIDARAAHAAPPAQAFQAPVAWASGAGPGAHRVALRLRGGGRFVVRVPSGPVRAGFGLWPFVFGARFVAPPIPVYVGIHTYPYGAWTDPGLTTVYPPCCYHPPPPAPAPAPAPPPPRQPPAIYERVVVREPPTGPRAGLFAAGVAQSPVDRGTPLGGVAAGLELRGAGLAAFRLEGEALGANLADGSERRQLGVGAGLRLYFWNAPLTLFAGASGGAAYATFAHAGDGAGAGAVEEAVQLLGKLGGGLELRLGSHLALDASLSGVSRLTVSGEPKVLARAGGDGVRPGGQLDRREGAVEGRLGLALRF